MSQANANLLINGANPVVVGGASTSVLYFPPAPGSSIGVASSAYGFVFMPGSNRWNGQLFTARACGNFKPGVDVTSPTVTIGLYAAKNLQPNVNPNNQIAQANVKPALTISTVCSATIAAAGLGIVASPWSLTANMNVDGASGILQGQFNIQADNGAATTGAITAITGVDPSLPTPLGFLVGITFSVAGSGNTASMYQFELDS